MHPRKYCHSFFAPLQIVFALVFIRSIGLSRQIHDIDSLNAEGSKLYVRGEYKLALEKHYGALSMALRLDNNNRTAETLGFLAQAEMQLDLFDSVVVHCNRMLGIARSTKNPKFEATALRTLADVHSRRREYPEATRFYTDAARIAEEIPDSAEMAIIYGNLGNVYGDVGQFDTALKLYRRSLVINKALRVPRRVADALQNIGIVHVQQGNLPLSLVYLDSAQKEYTLIKDYVSVGRTLSILGSVYDEQGAFPKGIESLQQALAMAEKTQIPSDIAYALGNIGIHYWNLGEYAKTLHYFSRANSIFEQLHDNYSVSITYANLGALYTSLGDYAQALFYLQRSLRLKEELNELAGIAIVYSTIGTIYGELDSVQQATLFLNKSLEMCRRVGDMLTAAKVHIAIAGILLRQKKFRLCEKHIMDGLKLFRAHGVKTQEAGALVSLGELRRAEHKLNDAARYFGDALAIAKEINSPEWTWKSQAGLGVIHEASRQLDRARADFTIAMDALEHVRTTIEAGELRATFLESQISPYESLVRVLATMHAVSPTRAYADDAFVVVERFKSRSFVELLAESRADVRRGLSEEQKLNEYALLKRITRAQSQLVGSGVDRSAMERALQEVSAAEDALLLLQTEFRRTNPAYANLKYPKAVNVHAVQTRLLADGELLLEFSLGTKQSFLWMISKESVRLVQLPSSKIIEEQARKFVHEIQRRPTTQTYDLSMRRVRKYGMQLSETLFGKAINEIAAAKKLIIVPDGVLFYVPFEALTLPKSLGNEYLVERVPVSYVQSATVLDQLQEKTDSLRQHDGDRFALLAFGDPVFASASLANINATRSLPDFYNIERLISTREEVKQIASYFPASKVRVYLGDTATEANIKKENLRAYRYLHFATHGFLDERVPSRSGLLFSTGGDTTEDGLLQMNEILNLDMNPDLVVLSACETGLGKLVKGEGMIGLTRAFHYAGARSLVVSLWKVADVSTAELMKSFYATLATTHSSTNALRDAKRSMIRSAVPIWRHPYHWAAFVVQGDGGRTTP